MNALRSISLTALATTALVAMAYGLAALFEGWDHGVYLALTAFVTLIAPVTLAVTAFHFGARKCSFGHSFALSIVLFVGGLLIVFAGDALVVNSHLGAAALLRADYLGWFPALALLSLVTPIFHRRFERESARHRVLEDLFG